MPDYRDDPYSDEGSSGNQGSITTPAGPAIQLNPDPSPLPNYDDSGIGALIATQRNASNVKTPQYGGVGILGGDRHVPGNFTQQQVVNASGRNSLGARISQFLGLKSAVGRDVSPLGGLADCKNVVLNSKAGAMVMRNGYASYITSLTTLDGISPDKFPYFFRQYPKVPSAQTVDCVAGYYTSGSSKQVYQKPFFSHDGTANNNWITWGESTNGILSAVGTATISYVGGSSTTNYYKYWLVFDENTGEYSYVASSSYSAGTTTLTLFENRATGWHVGDTIDLYRHFHDNAGFIANFDSTGAIQPVFCSQGDGILFSGGASSTVSYKPCLSTYLSFTWMPGKTAPLTYKGTYITEAEIKSSAGYTIGNIGTAAGSLQLDQSYRYFVGFSFETFDGQRSNLIKASTNYTNLSGSNYAVTSLVTLKLPQLNKRFRYLNVFMGRTTDTNATTLDWSEYFLVRTIDLTSSTDAAQWTYNAPGANVGTYTQTLTLDNSDWLGISTLSNGEQENLVLHLGHTECTSTTASFSQVKAVNGRLFIANYYDYNDAVTEVAKIRWCPIGSNGIFQVNVLPNIDGTSQAYVNRGDPTSVEALARWEDKLFILKDSGAYYIPVTEDSTTWQIVTAGSFGCDAPLTVTECPDGIRWLKSGDAAYFWNGAYPVIINLDWISDYRAISTTNKATWCGWYDAYNKSWCTNPASTAGSATFYMQHLDYGGAWVKHVLNDTIYFVSVDSLGNIFFTVTTLLSTSVQLFSTATSDNGTGIYPYFKTNPIVLDEKNIGVIDFWHLALDTPAGGSGTLDMKLITAGAANSATQTYSAASKSIAFHRRGADSDTGRGRRVQFEFNANGTPATFTSFATNEFGIDYHIVPLTGDAMITS